LLLALEIPRAGTGHPAIEMIAVGQFVGAALAANILAFGRFDACEWFAGKPAPTIRSGRMR
jgi:hypothetical protein